MTSNYNPQPLVTIITVVYNGAEFLEKTILSVLNQTYSNIEYIIIDGKSNDGTLDIIKKYKNRTNKWISEPDKGIYDAMNKGIDLATGEWINFMNAGDVFFNDSIVESVFNINNHTQYDLIYGDCEYIYNSSFSIHKKTKSLDDLWKFMPFCHQSLFMKTDILKKYHFNLNNISADHELLYKCYKNKLKFLKTDLIIASYIANGESEKKCIEVIKGRWQGVSKLTPSLKIDLYYIYFIIKQNIRLVIRRILPENIKTTLLTIKHYNKKLF